MAEFSYEIKEKIAVLSDNGAWETQVNLISWNHAKPKYDIRKWNVETGKMSKGVSLTEEEWNALGELFSLAELYDNGKEEE